MNIGLQLTGKRNRRALALRRSTGIVQGHRRSSVAVVENSICHILDRITIHIQSFHSTSPKQHISCRPQRRPSPPQCRPGRFSPVSHWRQLSRAFVTPATRSSGDLRRQRSSAKRCSTNARRRKGRSSGWIANSTNSTRQPRTGGSATGARVEVLATAR